MATTISSYSVSLSLDASQYIKNSSLGRAETGRLVREINAARSPADNYQRSINLIDKALKQGAIEQSTYNRLLGEAQNKFSQATTKATDYVGSLTRLAGAYIGVRTIKDFATETISLASAAESAAIQFEVLTGSEAEASKMVDQLRRLAAVTPLTLTDTQAAARTMLSFNVETSRILPTLKMLGDVTGGNSERFKMMTLAFSQMNAAGRMMGQDLLQMINAGFNPLQEIALKTGESMLQLKKRMEDGAISSDEVAAAFASATSEGGRFFGMIDRMAETTEGKMTRLRDQIESIKRDLGTALLPAANAALDTGSVWARQFRVGAESLMRGEGYADTMNAEQEAMRKMQEQMDFFNQQRALRAAGSPTLRTQSSLDATSAAKAEQERRIAQREASAGLEAAVTRGIEALKTGGGGLMDAIRVIQQSGQMIAQVGMANTEKLIESQKQSPAIESLEVGTQEAYQYMIQAQQDSLKQASEAEKRRLQLEENAKQQRETMNKWLDKINQALENNGFKRIR